MNRGQLAQSHHVHGLGSFQPVGWRPVTPQFVSAVATILTPFILSRQCRNQTGNTITGETAARGVTMAAAALTDRYAANLHGVLSCYDRIIVTGTLAGACYAGGMTSFLYSRHPHL